MPRFHIHMNDGHVSTNDVDGFDSVDLETAMSVVLQDARHMMSESDRNGLCRRHWRADIADPSGNIVATIAFAHALIADYLPGPA